MSPFTFLLLSLLASLSYAAGSTCIPSSCTYLCCDASDQCASTTSACAVYDTNSFTTCIAAFCTEGCCYHGFCGTPSQCGTGTSRTFYIIVIIVVIVFFILCAIGLTYKYKRDQKRRAEYLKRRQIELSRNGGSVEGVPVIDHNFSGFIDPDLPPVGGIAIPRGPDPTMNIFDPYAFGNSLHNQPFQERPVSAIPNINQVVLEA